MSSELQGTSVFTQETGNTQPLSACLYSQGNLLLAGMNPMIRAHEDTFNMPGEYIFLFFQYELLEVLGNNMLIY